MTPIPNVFVLARGCVRRTGHRWFIWFPAKTPSRGRVRKWVIAADGAPRWA